MKHKQALQLMFEFNCIVVYYVSNCNVECIYSSVDIGILQFAYLLIVMCGYWGLICMCSPIFMTFQYFSSQEFYLFKSKYSFKLIW